MSEVLTFQGLEIPRKEEEEDKALVAK